MRLAALRGFRHFVRHAPAAFFVISGRCAGTVISALSFWSYFAAKCKGVAPLPFLDCLGPGSYSPEVNISGPLRNWPKPPSTGPVVLKSTQRVIPPKGQLRTFDRPAHEPRLGHMRSQRGHDAYMRWVLDEGPQRVRVLPRGECPESLEQWACEKGIAEQTCADLSCFITCPV